MENSEFVSGPTISQLPCRVHPQVILTILDLKTRHSSAVSGPILGYVSDDSVIEVTDCFLVEQNYADESNESEEVFYVDKSQLLEMYDLKTKISPKETVIGWFTTEAIFDSRAVSFMNWFSSKEGTFVSQQHIPTPLYLTLDTKLAKKATLPIDIYALGASATPVKPSFTQVPFEINRLVEDPSALIMMTRARRTTGGQAGRTKSHSEAIAAVAAPLTVLEALDDLEILLMNAQGLVEKVLKDKVKPNVEAARLLFNALGRSQNGLIEVEEFKKLVDASIEDSTIITEFANVCKVQSQLLDVVSSLTTSTKQ